MSSFYKVHTAGETRASKTVTTGTARDRGAMGPWGHGPRAGEVTEKPGLRGLCLASLTDWQRGFPPTSPPGKHCLLGGCGEDAALQRCLPKVSKRLPFSTQILVAITWTWRSLKYFQSKILNASFKINIYYLVWKQF